jgi:hypothetical protein
MAYRVSPWENGDSRPICRALPGYGLIRGHAKMAQNPVLARLALSLSKGLVPAALASAALALLPLQLISEGCSGRNKEHALRVNTIDVERY